MNGEGFHSSMSQQQVMVDESNPKWWSKSNSRMPPGHGFSDLLHQPPSVSSADTTVFPHYPSQPSHTVVPVASLPDSHDLPADSWTQLLLEEEKHEMCLLQSRNTDNRETERQAKNSPLFSAPMASDHVSRYVHSHGSEEEEAEGIFPWCQLLPEAAAASSPRCSTSVCCSMLDFSIKNKRHHPETQCNSTSTGEAHKKSKVSSEPCAFKVRKEKLGDRITALHQLISPFGKTDTASVLLEAIGYIRFLQSQVEALSTPYLGCGSGNKRQPSEDDEKMSNNDDQPKKKKKDLRSRGLCLVPVSFTLHVGNDTGTPDYWAPAFTSGDGGFR